MPDQLESSPLPEPPEAPEAAKWMHFTWHHLRENWKLLMKPVVLAVILGVGYLSYRVGITQSEDLVKVKDERAAFLNDQVAAYKDRLQGATPDQAAAQIAALKRDVAASAGKIEGLIEDISKISTDVSGL